VLGDALDYVAEHGHEYDAIFASPPCQSYAQVTEWRGSREDHPDLVAATRAALRRTGRPWIIENVLEAPIRRDLVLCGSHFGLRVRRHRAFETSWQAFGFGLPPCDHRRLLPFAHKGERAYADAMGCDWMTNREGRQAIPPAYTEYVGRLLRSHIESEAA
jgi:DNA (cytosine-5)-methyltransferase 1